MLDDRFDVYDITMNYFSIKEKKKNAETKKRDKRKIYVFYIFI